MKRIPSITVRNAQRRLRFDLARLQDFSERALRRCLDRGPDGPLVRLTEVDVLLVSDKRIAALHKKFMNIAGPTDVITFQHGEIFISVETAARQARRFKSSTESEVRLYLVHGLLHLLGFDDTTPAEARRMEKVQTEIVSQSNETTQ